MKKPPLPASFTPIPLDQAQMSSLKDSQESVEVYGDFLLTIYDFFVLSFVCPLIWGCTKVDILALYNKYVTHNHLDIGVGTGYFLDRCHFLKPNPHITLLDLSPNCLSRTAKRIKRYQPTVVMADIYEPLPLEESKFDSVSLNYLLHCLPGSMKDKARVFENVKPFLNPGAVIFGATVLGKNINSNFLARKLMKFYNRKGIFNNLDDDAEGLKLILQKYFTDVSISIAGCVAIFTARLGS